MIPEKSLALVFRTALRIKSLSSPLGRRIRQCCELSRGLTPDDVHVPQRRPVHPPLYSCSPAAAALLQPWRRTGLQLRLVSLPEARLEAWSP